METRESLMILKQILCSVLKKHICKFFQALPALKITVKVTQTLNIKLTCTDVLGDN